MQLSICCLFKLLQIHTVLPDENGSGFLECFSLGSSMMLEALPVEGTGGTLQEEGLSSSLQCFAARCSCCLFVCPQSGEEGWWGRWVTLSPVEFQRHFLGPCGWLLSLSCQLSREVILLSSPGQGFALSVPWSGVMACPVTVAQLYPRANLSGASKPLCHPSLREGCSFLSVFAHL